MGAKNTNPQAPVMEVTRENISVEVNKTIAQSPGVGM